MTAPRRVPGQPYGKVLRLPRPRTRTEAGSPTHFDLTRALTSVNWPKGLRYPERLTLLALWAHSDFNGGVCRPGIPRLARCAGLSMSQVHESLKALRDAGAVSWESRPGFPNVYTVSFDFVRELVAGDPHWTRTPPPRAGVQGNDSERTPPPHGGDPSTREQGPLHPVDLTPPPGGYERGSKNGEKKQRVLTGSADTPSPSGSQSLNDTTHHPTTPGKGKAKAPTYQAVAERIVEASRAYGGDVEVRTRRVMGRFQREPLATLAHAELGKIEKAAGLPKGTLALQALFEAREAGVVRTLRGFRYRVHRRDRSVRRVPTVGWLAFRIAKARGLSGKHAKVARDIAMEYKLGGGVSFTERKLKNLAARAHVSRGVFPSWKALVHAGRATA